LDGQAVIVDQIAGGQHCCERGTAQAMTSGPGSCLTR
jgi:hypothetical protein